MDETGINSVRPSISDKMKTSIKFITIYKLNVYFAPPQSKQYNRLAALVRLFTTFLRIGQDTIYEIKKLVPGWNL